MDMKMRERKFKMLELRYNPYHDPSNGRFTSGGGGGSGGVMVVPRGQKGKGYYASLNKGYSDEEIDDMYENYKNNTSSFTRPPEADIFISNYQNSKTEKAIVITPDGETVNFDGIEHHVVGEQKDFSIMNGGYSIHNHPIDTTFSNDDIVNGLIKGKLNTMEVVTSGGTIHTLQNIGSSDKDLKTFNAQYRNVGMRFENEANKRIAKGENINKTKYVSEHLEKWLDTKSKEYGLKYSKSKIGHG